MTGNDSTGTNKAKGKPGRTAWWRPVALVVVIAAIVVVAKVYELDQKLDALPQAKYWDQVRNGMWMRSALISSIFNVDVAIRDHYHAYYAF